MSTEVAISSSIGDWGALYSAGPISLNVRTNIPWAHELLHTAYAPLMCKARDGTPHHCASFIDTDKGSLVYLDNHAIPYRHADSHNPFTRAFYATNELFARFAALVPGHIALYGASILVENQAVLIVGPSAVGKTTLAVHLAHQGAHFLGDEIVMFDFKRSLVSVIPRRPALRESVLPLLPNNEFRDAVLRAPFFHRGANGKFWYALRGSDLCGIEPDARPFPLRAIIMLQRGNEPALESHAPTGILQTVVAQAYVRPQNLSHIAAIHRALQNVPACTLTIGAPQHTATFLLDRLRTCL